MAWAFSLAICFLGLAAAWGGTKLPSYGPRKLATIGGVLFGSGYLLAAAALHWRSLPLLYLGYGVVGGTGLGLGYVTPVATVAKWFPDRKGLATGMVIMGFGFGRAVDEQVIAPAFATGRAEIWCPSSPWLGVVLHGGDAAGSLFLRNPPPGYLPPRGSASGAMATLAWRCRHFAQNMPTASVGMAPVQAAPTAAILSLRFAAMWMIFFCNIVAGISIISFQSPIFQDLWHASIRISRPRRWPRTAPR